MDQKVVIYGLQSDGGDPPVITSRAFTFDVYNFLGVNLYLGGALIFSTTGFGPQTIDNGLFDWVPTVGLSYMAGQNAELDPYWGALSFLSTNTATNAGDALNVCELIDAGATDAPVAATAAQVNISAAGDNYVRISGIQVTLNCVAAQVAPVTITVTQDPVDNPGVIFTARLTGAAGTTVPFVCPINLAAFKGAQIDVSAPAATNFVTLSVQANSSIGSAGILGGP